MSESVTLGREVQARTAFTTPLGVPLDLSDVNLVIHKPDGTHTDVDTGDVTHTPATGVYTYLVTLDQVGVWQFEWFVGETSDNVEDILAVEPRLIGTFSEDTIPPLCGSWFDVTSEHGAPCCDAHEGLSLRPGCPPPYPVEDDCAEPTVEQVALLTTSFLRSAWGPAWPGWLCATARYDARPSCVDAWPRRHWASRPPWCGPPAMLLLPEARFQCVDIAVTVDGVRVANADLRVEGGNMLAYQPDGVPAGWPAGLIVATYRYGAVPPGAWLPWSRLYCALRRLYRPSEALATNLPVNNHVTSISTSGASLDYSDEEIRQGVMGWDAIVSAFVTAGAAQAKDAGLVGGSWAPPATAGVALMERSYPSFLQAEE